jgi:glucose/arabinose dehydrogenase
MKTNKNLFIGLIIAIFWTIQLSAKTIDTSLTLPEGFKAYIFADNLGRARHIVVNDNGDVFVSLRELKDGKGIVALRDQDQDHQADQIQYFFNQPGTGLAWHKDYLYFAPDTAVYRFKFEDNELVPKRKPEQIVKNLTEQRQHAAKTITLDGDELYLNIGAPSNACQEQMRTPGSPGMDPCPLLEEYGGIWHFDANAKGQIQEEANHYATGLRHCVALDWNHECDELYVVMHGRDQLYSLWKEKFTQKQNAELPAEEFLRIKEGSNSGWPYCYYDHFKGKKVLAPEYGGDGEKIGRCGQYNDPLIGFPAHWAPNDLIFYNKDQFPEKYHGGALIAFHGSWNRAPFPQQGYKVVFVAFNECSPDTSWEVFADGFSGEEELKSPYEAEYRPMGLATGPDGSLFITDSRKGRVWKVIYTGG